MLHFEKCWSNINGKATPRRWSSQCVDLEPFSRRALSRPICYWNPSYNRYTEPTACEHSANNKQFVFLHWFERVVWFSFRPYQFHTSRKNAHGTFQRNWSNFPVMSSFWQFEVRIPKFGLLRNVKLFGILLRSWSNSPVSLGQQSHG